MPTKKNILVVKSSPREKGNSNTLADQLVEGARAAGAAVDVYNVAKMDIRPCDACDGCRGGMEPNCIVDDDMQLLYPKLKEADAIVLSSPIYWFSVSAQAKLFIDRWYGLGSDEDYPLVGKQLALILTYADEDPFAAGAGNAIRMFQDICRWLKTDVAGIVYGTADGVGDVQKQPQLMEKARQLGEQLGKP